jgi:hypothetical protein
MLVERRRILGFAHEDTKGTAETVSTALAATAVYDASIEADGIMDGGDRDAHQSFAGLRAGSPGMTKGKAAFTTELAPDCEIGTILEACGYEHSAGVYTPTNVIDNHETATIALWEDGRKQQIHGAAGSGVISADNAGARVMAAWDFMGVLNDATDQALPTDADPALPFTAVGLTIQLASVDIAPVSGFTLDLGQQLERRESITSGSGILCAVVTGHRPTLQIAPEAVEAATKNYIGDLIAGNTFALDLTITDGAGSSIAIAAPAAQIASHAPGSRHNLITEDMTINLTSETNAAPLTITVTNA